MGLYDELKCEYPLPDAMMQDELFQTKSFHCEMTLYTITVDGRLIHHMVRWEIVPEEERPRLVESRNGIVFFSKPPD